MQVFINLSSCHVNMLNAAVLPFTEMPKICTKHKNSGSIPRNACVACET